MPDLEQLRFPIGRFFIPKDIKEQNIQDWIGEIEAFPTRIQEEVKGLSKKELAWRYRPDGWNIQQVVHHCADSHMNAFVRFKLALSENNPTIRPYNEKAWAEMVDTLSTPIAFSELILTGLHTRWTTLLKGLNPTDYQKTFFHPESQKSYRLDITLALYAWHCNHHLGHIKQAKHYEGQF